jgi:ATP/maltotriose-dependent transcriptional regulator MalT
VRETLGVSDREFEVLTLLAKGLLEQGNRETTRRLAEHLKTHVASLFEKLESKRRTEAISRARELGILQ